MRIKISEVAQAIRANGLPQKTGTYFDVGFDGDKYAEPIGSACAIGMAAYNLDVHPDTLASKLFEFKAKYPDNYTGQLDGLILKLNDSEHKTFDEIATALEEWVVLNGDRSIDIMKNPRLYVKGRK